MLGRLALACAALFLSGCGALIQTALGWTDDRLERRVEHHNVSITSNPPNAEVTRKTDTTDAVLIGRTPLTDSLEYTVEMKIESPKFAGILTGALIEIGAGIALITQSSTREPVPGILGAYCLLAGVPELLAALIYGASGDSIRGRTTLENNRNVFYTARLDGYPDTMKQARIPDQGKIELIMGATNPGGVLVAAPPPVQAPKPATQKSWVVAIMDVEDANAARQEQAIDRGLLRNTGDQLRIFIAQQSVRTIDRGAQEKVLREQISAMKNESFKECYDDSCQLELGKALAASHILRSRVTRFGRRCVLNTELIDLVAEVTVAASSAQGDCGDEGFLSMSEEVAKKLFIH